MNAILIADLNWVFFLLVKLQIRLQSLIFTRLTCDGQSIEQIQYLDYSSSDDRCVVKRAQSSARREDDEISIYKINYIISWIIACCFAVTSLFFSLTPSVFRSLSLFSNPPFSFSPSTAYDGLIPSLDAAGQRRDRYHPYPYYPTTYSHFYPLAMHLDHFLRDCVQCPSTPPVCNCPSSQACIQISQYVS